ncbi:hypothetical protein C1Y63_07305 [Corynebacterium sp. 13CS0277]|uniref:hypothetical protein n=1 Tax=Corynebacterium sp. 13CS0277 TaxID=2071994 RepID=UPI000D0451D2|nr:hypothetical protein [Corynebacterium sp. 13CS0277]PRQ11194.1 hypothetical protein C1Y63_07305 [Corynebacterium sp. 13CS0277]
MQKALYAVPGAQPRLRSTVALLLSALIVLVAALYGSMLLLNRTSLQAADTNPQAVTLPVDDLGTRVAVDSFPPSNGRRCAPDDNELDPARYVSRPMPEAYTIGSMSCSFAETISGELLPQLRQALTVGGGTPSFAAITSLPDPAPQPNPFDVGTGSAASRIPYQHRGVSVVEPLYNEHRARQMTVTCSLLDPTKKQQSPVVCTAPLGMGVVYESLATLDGE